MGVSGVGSNSPISMQQTAGTSSTSSVSFSSKLAGGVTPVGSSGTSGKAVIQAALDGASDDDKKAFMQSMLQSIGMSAIASIQSGPTLDPD